MVGKIKLKEINTILEILSDMPSIEIKYIEQILDIEKDFCKRLAEEEEKLPYNINLIDETVASENAHSRILVRLLQYSENGKYILLNSFLYFLKEPFRESIFENPEITAEKNRIDARIRDNKKSIIIENKIHFAGDQNKQIERYIENEKNHCDENNIYVLYLTREGGAPSVDSLSPEKRKKLGQRYREISYRYDILEWLKNINENTDFCENAKKTELLKSAIIQYIDHLKGLFYMREGEKEMRNEMVSYLKKKLNLESEDNIENRMKRISDLKEYCEEFQKILNELEKEILFEALKDFEKQLEEYQFDDIESKDFDGNLKRFGEKDSAICFKPSGWKEQYWVGLGFSGELSYLFYGIYNQQEDSPKDFRDSFNDIISQDNDPNEAWPFGIWLDQGENHKYLLEKIRDGSLLKTVVNGFNEIIRKTRNVKELYKD